MDAAQQQLQAYGSRAKQLLRPLLICVALLWLIELFDRVIFNGSLDSLGIAPRQAIGLIGIAFGPLLHDSFAHLLANTGPLLVLGFLVLVRQGRRIVVVSAVILLISGLGTWLTGPPHTVHIGASGLVFGYFSFLVVSAYYERSLTAVVLAVFVIALYWGLLGGILPAAGISWQGHLFGLVGGGAAAYLFCRRPNRV
jgi:membrane associated rhomboid family serine protease